MTMTMTMTMTTTTTTAAERMVATTTERNDP
jgi:hypothetical protein